jgi:hypothetical protein
VKDVLLGRGMADQVEDFASGVQSKAIVFDPDHTLFFLAGGLNDRRLPSAETVANLKGEIRKLYGLGGRHFRIALLPTAIPAFREVGLRLNPELQKIPAEVEADLTGAHVRLSHWGLFFDEVMQNPSAYGIENTKDACAGRAIFNEDATPHAESIRLRDRKHQRRMRRASDFQRRGHAMRQAGGILLLPRRPSFHCRAQGRWRQAVR